MVPLLMVLESDGMQATIVSFLSTTSSIVEAAAILIYYN